MTDEKEKKNTDIEIVSGDGKNLDISRVYDHIKMDKKENTENSNKKQEIVIPKSKESKNNN